MKRLVQDILAKSIILSPGTTPYLSNLRFQQYIHSYMHEYAWRSSLLSPLTSNILTVHISSDSSNHPHWHSYMKHPHKGQNSHNWSSTLYMFIYQRLLFRTTQWLLSFLRSFLLSYFIFCSIQWWNDNFLSFCGLAFIMKPFTTCLALILNPLQWYSSQIRLSLGSFGGHDELVAPFPSLHPTPFCIPSLLRPYGHLWTRIH